MRRFEIGRGMATRVTIKTYGLVIDVVFIAVTIIMVMIMSIFLQNKKPINLSKKIVDIMGGLKFKIADDPNFLRFYPFVLRDTEK